jgi:hypothetical protein
MLCQRQTCTILSLSPWLALVSLFLALMISSKPASSFTPSKLYASSIDMLLVGDASGDSPAARATFDRCNVPFTSLLLGANTAAELLPGDATFEKHLLFPTLVC